jgi:hypothetical protein
VGLLASAAVAGVPVDAKEIYETADRNYLIVLAAVISEVVSLKSEALRNAEKGHG